jgi:hypothetical protein
MEMLRLISTTARMVTCWLACVYTYINARSFLDRSWIFSVRRGSVRAVARDVTKGRRDATRRGSGGASPYQSRGAWRRPEFEGEDERDPA